MAAVPLLENNNPTVSLDGDDDETEKMSPVILRQKRKPLLRRENFCWAVLGCVLLSVLLGIAAGSAMLVLRGWSNNDDDDEDSCIRQTTMMPSPLTRDFDMTYHTQQFNGSFMEETVYRRAASPEVDAAWEALGVNYRAVRVPQEVGPQVGLAADKVQINDKYGGGYPANVEGLHHLHCLNLLRQSLYWNIDYYRAQGTGAFVNGEHVVRKHVSHCMDIIRQQLMCTVDVGMLGQVWWQPQDQQFPEAFVDFNTKHVCRNYEDVRKWAHEHQLPEEVPEDYLAPPQPGQKILDHLP
ncbi:tat pathway signal sequence [Lecanosticta acicola]|uniref:Tat pathway signal sequence n=1 Tax=Lecanosticta acicola TaxID=111012 RepID=A0AAI9EFN9_9PEZI|nr:tat pathway signal sequence [Lecanosticta acicola]